MRKEELRRLRALPATKEMMCKGKQFKLFKVLIPSFPMKYFVLLQHPNFGTSGKFSNIELNHLTSFPSRSSSRVIYSSPSTFKNISYLGFFISFLMSSGRNTACRNGSRSKKIKRLKEKRIKNKNHGMRIWHLCRRSCRALKNGCARMLPKNIT